MNRSQSLKALLLLLLLVPNCQGQAFTSGATESSSNRRDEGALGVLKSTLLALTPGEGSTISDYRLEGTVTRWDGREISGTFSTIGVGAADRRTSISIGSPVFSLLVINNAGILQFGASNPPRNIPNEIAMEAPYYFFLNLLQEALQDQHVEVILTPSPDNSPNIEAIKITRHMAIWAPAMGTLGSAQFEVYIDTSSNTVTRIVNLARLESNFGQTVPHVVNFSDYRREQGWLLPHNIDETYAGAPHNSFTLVTYSFNKGLSISDLSSQ